MADRHQRDKTTFRPPPEVKTAAQEALAGTDWTLNDYLVACLVALGEQPIPTLARLAAHRPAPRRGRPRATPAETS